MTVAPDLKAPFPYAGGKGRVADMVWDRFGNVDNYVEPFAGSLAVLLRRPPDHFANGYRVETVNDVNHYLVNFWRAVKEAPDLVAKYADQPVSEADLHARHKFLMRGIPDCPSPPPQWEHGLAVWKQAYKLIKGEAWNVRSFRRHIAESESYFDARTAGWWVWGQCTWIASGWCNETRTDYEQIPAANTDGLGYGVNRGDAEANGRPQLADAFDIGRGVNGGGNLKRQMPGIGQKCDTGGIGVNGAGPDLPQKRPHFSFNGIGSGTNGLGPQHPDLVKGRPSLGGTPTTSGTGFTSFRNVTDSTIDGICEARADWLVAWMRRLSDRHRLVRTCYGHWSRVCDSKSTLTRLGKTGVFLDPPYPIKSENSGKKSRDGNLYASDKNSDLDKLRDEVRDWCVRHGENPDIRIAVCGYEGDGYESLVDLGWTCESWEASGGYGNQRKGNKGKSENAKRERIWFNPSCIAAAPTLFDSFT